MPHRSVRQSHLITVSVISGALAAALVVLILVTIPFGSTPTRSVLVVWITPGASIQQITKIKQATYAVQGTTGCAFWNPNTIPESVQRHLPVSEWSELSATSKASSFRCQVLSASQVTRSMRSMRSIGAMKGVMAVRIEPLGDYRPRRQPA
jgi:hypothetical protein